MRFNTQNVFICFLLFFSSCQRKSEFGEVVSIQNLVFDDVDNCGNLTAYKYIGQDNFLVISYFGANKNYTFNMEDTLRPYVNIFIEKRSQCYTTPNLCSDIVIDVKIDKSKNKCKIFKYDFVKGKINLQKKDSIVSIDLNSCEWSNGNKELIKLKHLNLVFIAKEDIGG
jgi:hypothetical protein